MTLNVPELSLVVLVGVSGSGKSTFAKQHFGPYETVSSDFCRGLVANDENDQTATKDAFELLHYIVGKRLRKGLLTVVDATNVQPASRKRLIDLARTYHVLPVAIVFDLPQIICEARTALREDRTFGKHVIRKQRLELKRSLRKLKREGFRKIHLLSSETDVADVEGITRSKLYSDKRELSGPFDIIGDVHGCYAELRELLQQLGYVIADSKVSDNDDGIRIAHPDGRRLIFLGDLVDRGPASPAVLRLVMDAVRTGVALCVPGNHDAKLQKHLHGKRVQLKHGLAETVAQLSDESDDFKNEVKEFIYGLVSHYVPDQGRLVVSHAGIREEMIGRGSGAVRAFCMYGESTGEIDEFGFPVRYEWAKEYRGDAKVVYGHTPVPEAEWLNRTINIDTGCVFGGKLTALRYPEELVSVPAKEVYWEPAKPLHPDPDQSLTAQQANDDLIDIEDVLGKRIVQTRLRSNLTIKEENAIPALEIMSRFAIDPKWLIYLPPTMSPCEVSALPEYLEHPGEALFYYGGRGVTEVICEEKHMGSRAILIVCKDAEAAKLRFGVTDDRHGVCYTRTGRPFFQTEALEADFMGRIRQILDFSDFWESLNTDWVCLDAELMPWSAKAQSLIKDQYASVGAAAGAGLNVAEQALHSAAARGVDGVSELLAEVSHKQYAVKQFRKVYQAYTWPVNSIDDYRLAPFHILATEGAVHTDKSHHWHMTMIDRYFSAGKPIYQPTKYVLIDPTDPADRKRATDWWLELTSQGGEGMVVKPTDFIAYGGKGLLQPAVKCRGREYLRIIYGPEYDLPQNLARLKNRSLGRKRSLAIREFALGVEALERFVNREPTRRVHECVFSVLALESEKVDPRL